MSRRDPEAARRFAERRKREDDAPRLSEEVPRLESLKLEVEERRPEGAAPEIAHIRRIIVERAPALFDLSCGDTACTDGGHDVTHAVMRALRAGQENFEGEDVCHGHVRSAPCRRILRYVGNATYRR
jgi:hypothetical protein